MTLRMRVMPRFPAIITGANGLAAIRDGADLIVKNDFADMVRIPGVNNGDKQFFLSWNSDQDYYSILSFNDLFTAVQEFTGFMAASVYDPQGKIADAFNRANHTGLQAIATITGLQAKLDALTAAGAIPGDIKVVTGNAAPSGWLKANGALLSRTTYSDLWTFAQASSNIAASDAAWSASQLYGQFSPGDGSTTFRIPDYRGMFPRAWDDSRGADAGRAIGTFQDSANRSHSHTGSTDTAAAHAHGVTDPGHTHVFAQWQATGGGNSAANAAASNSVATTVNSSNTGISIQAAGSHSHAVTTVASGGTEARPQNVAALFCIKY